MAVKQQFTSPGQSTSVIGASIGYFTSFTGTSFTAQLQVLFPGAVDWLPAAPAINQGTPMTEPAFTGRKNSQEPLMWRWNVTAVTAGTLTVYLG
ncbi:MAG: hypothetical protein WAO08_37395 [Hyphomicrobiaceae bacterium]